MDAIDRTLNAVLGRKPAPPPSAVAEATTLYGAPHIVGVYVPEAPIIPADAKLTGYMVHTTEGVSFQTGYDAATPADAARLLVEKGVEHHRIHALAETDCAAWAAVWDPLARRWGQWRIV